jgi:HAD superfamily hydrolase (TIGR01509 family)
VIRAFLFDFDGLILDTESASLAAWKEVYADYSQDFPSADWIATIGSLKTFDSIGHLEGLGVTFDREAVVARRRSRRDALLAERELRDGVGDYLDEAARRGLKTAIVTSANREWVLGHLARFERSEGWDAIVCADDDETRAKPQPTLYLEALEVLEVGSDEAIAFEDSPNGVQAATAAGIFCVAVPNSITRDLDLSAADLVVESLADLPPGELLWQVDGRVA